MTMSQSDSFQPVKNLSELEKFIKDSVVLPKSDSHKGQNGKLLIIGGSELFHGASKWSLDIASKFVDMVFYSSVPENNELIQEVKKSFWNGIVIPRTEIFNYIDEADCILIGPGMTRVSPEDEILHADPASWLEEKLSKDDWMTNTQIIVNYLLAQFPEKKWVIDAGALQMCDPRLLTERCILTPHTGELERLLERQETLSQFDEGDSATQSATKLELEQLSSFNHLHVSKLVNTGCLIVLKGEEDLIFNKHHSQIITGGNPGLTKGGTGDVLAGLLAALACTNDQWVASVAATLVNKRAGEVLAERTGPFFNASDLVEAIPQVLWDLISSRANSN